MYSALCCALKLSNAAWSPCRSPAGRMGDERMAAAEYANYATTGLTRGRARRRAAARTSRANLLLPGKFDPTGCVRSNHGESPLALHARRCWRHWRAVPARPPTCRQLPPPPGRTLQLPLPVRSPLQVHDGPCDRSKFVCLHEGAHELACTTNWRVARSLESVLGRGGMPRGQRGGARGPTQVCRGPEDPRAPRGSRACAALRALTRARTHTHHPRVSGTG